MKGMDEHDVMADFHARLLKARALFERALIPETVVIGGPRIFFCIHCSASATKPERIQHKPDCWAVAVRAYLDEDTP